MVFKLIIEDSIIYIRKNRNEFYSRSYDEPMEGEEYFSEEDGKYKRQYQILKDIYIASKYMFGIFDNIDVELFSVNDPMTFKGYVMLSHGDCEITNSCGQKHLIKSVYSRICFYNNGEFSTAVTDFEIFRSQYSMFEKERDYIHSHCNRTPGSIYFMDVCMGSSELGRKLISYRNINDTDWLDLFLHMDSYIKWESIEGGPYRTIDHLYAKAFGKESDISSYNVNKKIDTIRIFNNTIKPIITYQYSNLIVDSESLLKTLEDMKISKKNSSREGYEYEHEYIEGFNDMNETIINSEVFFNGKYLQVIIKNDASEYLSYIPTIFKFMNPRILRSVKEMINQDLSRIVIEKECKLIN